jgi:hypothetical protein
MPEHLSEAQIGARMVVVRRDDYEDTNDEVSSAHWCVAIAYAPVLMLHLLRYVLILSEKQHPEEDS